MAFLPLLRCHFHASRVPQAPCSRPGRLERIWSVYRRSCWLKQIADRYPEASDLRCRLEEIPDLVGSVDVPVGIAKQAPTVQGGMRGAVAAALDGVERDPGLARCGP